MKGAIPTLFFLEPGPTTRANEVELVYLAQANESPIKITSLEPMELLEATCGGQRGPEAIPMLAAMNGREWAPERSITIMPGAELRLRFRLLGDPCAHAFVFCRRVEVPL